jgi:antitoxin component HigA of HigAB toxin-antitoxin module
MKKISKGFELAAGDIPQSYEALCALYIPRPIHDKVSYENAVEIIDALAGHPLSKDQEDYLEAIALFVHEYESQFVEEPVVEPLELLNHLLEENGLAIKDLARILDVDISTAGRIAKGTRSITSGHAKKLGERFNVRPALFLGIN